MHIPEMSDQSSTLKLEAKASRGPADLCGIPCRPRVRRRSSRYSPHQRTSRCRPTSHAWRPRGLHAKDRRVPGRSCRSSAGRSARRRPRSDAAISCRSLPAGSFRRARPTSCRLAGTTSTVPTDPLWPGQWGPALIERAEGLEADQRITERGDRRARHRRGLEQPDLRAALVPGYDMVNGDNDPSDDNGHGTSTAGIAGARADNGVGISGVCPGCSIMPVKVSAATGRSTELQTSLRASPGRRITAPTIISISLAGSRRARPSPRRSTMRRARACSWSPPRATTGTRSRSIRPAIPGVLSVAGTDPDDKLYPWSNRGSWVAVAAPGCDITTFCGRLRPVLRHVGEHARRGGPGRSRPLLCAHGERGDGPAGDRFQRPSRRGDRAAAASTRSARSPRSARSSSPRRAARPRPRPADRASGPPCGARGADSSRAGLLRTGGACALAVRRGPSWPSLRSPKAGSCSIRLHSARRVAAVAEARTEDPTRWPRGSRRGHTPSTSVAVGAFRSRPP